MYHTPDHEQFHVLTNSHFTINAIQLLTASLNKLQAHTKYKYNWDSEVSYSLQNFQLSIDSAYISQSPVETCMRNELTPQSQVLLEKPRGPKPAKKFPAFYEARKFITADHKRLPLDPILRQMNPVHLLPSYFVTMPRQLEVLLTVHRDISV